MPGRIIYLFVFTASKIILLSFRDRDPGGEEGCVENTKKEEQEGKLVYPYLHFVSKISTYKPEKAA